MFHVFIIASSVALIVWHFTHDKKQTLAGLFHDIATPAFKHCVDFLNGDHLKLKVSREKKPENVYFVQEKIKVRYIDPLCRGKRMSRICEASKNMIRNNLSYDMNNFVFLDFNL